LRCGEDTFLKKGYLPRAPSSKNFQAELLLSSPIKTIPIFSDQTTKKAVTYLFQVFATALFLYWHFMR
jgi:hypothetical protein